MMVIDGYRIDAEITGEPTYENEATDFPIESGGSTTDHVIRKPVMFSCEGVVTDTPIGDIRDERVIQGTLTDVDPAVVALEGEEVSDAITRDAHARLVAIWSSKLPVIVKCSMGVFENMLLLTYVPKRVGGSIEFSATFKLATFVTNERAVVAIPRASKKDKIRLIPTNLKDERGRAIFSTGIGPNAKGPPYVFADGTAVPQNTLDKARGDAGAVKVKYVDGKAVPVNDSDYQPYTSKEPPFWPDQDKVRKVNAADFKSVGGPTSNPSSFSLPD